ncbi:MAG: hypothetical protein IJ785_01900 [Bacteroidales bacterium]|nr:hypothetical protein [Bacteroidales bacterium]
MRSLSAIMVACAALMLLLFGAGGIGVQRCSCTGHVSFVSSTGGGCCKSSKCMTVKVAQVSAAEMQQSLPDMGGVVLPCVCVACWADGLPMALWPYANGSLVAPAACTGPPGAGGHSMVMRV